MPESAKGLVKLCRFLQIHSWTDSVLIVRGQKSKLTLAPCPSSLVNMISRKCLEAFCTLHTKFTWCQGWWSKWPQVCPIHPSHSCERDLTGKTWGFVQIWHNRPHGLSYQLMWFWFWKTKLFLTFHYMWHKCPLGINLHTEEYCR